MLTVVIFTHERSGFLQTQLELIHRLYDQSTLTNVIVIDSSATPIPESWQTQFSFLDYIHAPGKEFYEKFALVEESQLSRLISFQTDDDLYYLDKNDIRMFLEAGSQVGQTPTYLAKKNTSRSGKNDTDDYLIWRGWLQVEAICKMNEINERFEKFIHQGPTSYYGLFSKKVFIERCQCVIKQVDAIQSTGNIDNCIILEDLCNIMHLGTPDWKFLSNSSTVRFLDKRKVQFYSWHALPIIKSDENLYEYVKQQSIEYLEKISSNSVATHFIKAQLDKMIEFHIHGYQNARSRLWRSPRSFLYNAEITKRPAKMELFQNEEHNHGFVLPKYSSQITFGIFNNTQPFQGMLEDLKPLYKFYDSLDSRLFIR